MRSWSTWNNQDQQQHQDQQRDKITSPLHTINSGGDLAYYSGKKYYQKILQIKILLFIFAKHF
jgi:hypothetical protein